MNFDSDVELLNGLLLDHLERSGLEGTLIAAVREQLGRCRPSNNESKLAEVFHFASTGSFTVVMSVAAGPLCEIEVNIADTVAELKNRILTEQGIPVSEQTLICGTTTMQDQHPVSQYKMSPLNAKILLIRSRSNVFFVVGGGGSNDEVRLHNLSAFNESSGTWSILPRMSTERAGLSAAVVNGKLYAFGGFNGRGVLQLVEVYDPYTNQWEELDNPLPKAVAYAGIAVISGMIYIMGGCLVQSGNDSISDTVMFNPHSAMAKNTQGQNSSKATGSAWSHCSDMPCARNAFGVAAVNEHIYAFGGYDDGVIADVSKFDTTNLSWSSLAPMERPRCMNSAVAIHGNIYVLGGWLDNEGMRALSDVVIFHTSSHTWSSFKPMNTARGHFAATSVGTKIYVVGGFGHTVLPSMEIIDVQGDVEHGWEQVPVESSAGASGIAIAVVDVCTSA